MMNSDLGRDLEMECVENHVVMPLLPTSPGPEVPEVEYVPSPCSTVNETECSNNGNRSFEKKKEFRGGQEAWQAMLYELLVYKSTHKDTNVKQGSNVGERERILSLWVQNQRRQYKLYTSGKKSSLNEERIGVLEATGFQWNLRGDSFWLKNFEDLIEYKRIHGDTMVPRRWKENNKLGEWVTDQRRQYKYKVKKQPSLLTEERQQKLEEIGFVWSMRKRTDWIDRFHELADFKEENGHCSVPQLYPQNKQLGKWVSKQREQYRFYLEGKQSAMDGNRYKMLTEIGFNWSVKGRKHAQIDFLERAINERNVPLSSFSEEYHDDGTEEGGNIDDSALMISKAPLHILMGDYNENPQEIAERAIESLQRTQAAKGNLEQPTEVDILLVDS